MDNNNYITIQGWMVNELKLSGNDLMVFAIIYGYSQDRESKFGGSIQYLADWCGCTRQGIQKNLKNLIDKGYIAKEDYIKDNVKRCYYYTTITEKGVQQSCTNNINNNINIISKDIISAKDSTEMQEEFDFGIQEKPKKPNLYTKCLDLIDEWTNQGEIRKLLKLYLDVCMEMKSIRGANQWKGMLNTLEKVQLQSGNHTYEEIIEQSINHSWKTFYPINDSFKGKQSEFIHIQKSDDYVPPTEEELKPAKNKDGTLKVY